MAYQANLLCDARGIGVSSFASCAGLRQAGKFKRYKTRAGALHGPRHVAGGRAHESAYATTSTLPSMECWWKLNSGKITPVARIHS